MALDGPHTSVAQFIRNESIVVMAAYHVNLKGGSVVFYPTRPGWPDFGVFTRDYGIKVEIRTTKKNPPAVPIVGRSSALFRWGFLLL
ncbi:hypothetical protein OUZ56_013889 [Daphnia magna]|uniref:Uncharacterized protein n=1 Tax=Daphnia magna TaxID=35525 RepID=A0ABQ9Z7A4_9CRUS|nr:hypothetical protein OUZ56_013889 [Daphnia magna]